MNNSSIKPRYKKPVLIAVKLDRKQAILTQCIIDGNVWNTVRTWCLGPGGALFCATAVRGVRRNTGVTYRVGGSKFDNAS